MCRFQAMLSPAVDVDRWSPRDCNREWHRLSYSVSEVLGFGVMMMGCTLAITGPSIDCTTRQSLSCSNKLCGRGKLKCRRSNKNFNSMSAQRRYPNTCTKDSRTA